MNENLQEKQPQKNNEGKKLLLILLVVLCWLLFIFGLMFASSKCSKAADFKQDYVSYVNSNFTVGQYWTDGSNYYYSNAGNQYIYNTNNNTWETMTWTGLTNFNATNVFYLSGYYYMCNNNTSCYQLNNTTWSSYTMNVSIRGSEVWNDGTNYYYSYNTTQYKWNTNNNTWETMTWTGLTSFRGDYVWTDGTNYYNTNSSVSYKLNNTTWSSVNINIITYGSNVYGSNLGAFFTVSTDRKVYFYDTNINDFVLSNLYYGQVVSVGNVNYLSGGNNTFVISNLSSGGGYTQQDLDEAYADGQLDALNTASSSTHGSGTTYSSYSDSAMESEVNDAYSSGHSTGYNAGVNSVMSNPHIYGLYTSTEYNVYGIERFDAGKLNALNTASSSTHGSGTTYTSYSSSSMSNEMNNAYSTGVTAGVSNVTNDPNTYGLYTQQEYDDNYTAGYNAGVSAGGYDAGYEAGRVYALDYVAMHGGNGVHQYSYSDAYLQYQIDYIYKDGQVSIANAASSYRYGSGTIYTHYNNLEGAIHVEMDYSYQLGYDAGYARGEDYWTLVLLNIASNTNGSSMVYNSFDMTDYTNELTTIYSTGVTNGASENYDSTYNSGFTAGQSSVLDNLSSYSLYSENDYDSAVASARSAGYTTGYQQGKLDYEDVDVSLPNTIVAIASVPYTVLSSMFNFNVLGLNIFIFVTSIISLVVVIWVIKKIWK